MVFRWRADDGPKLNAGLVALRIFRGSGPVFLRNPIFCDFSGGGGPDPLPPPPLDPCMKLAHLNYFLSVLFQVCKIESSLKMLVSTQSKLNDAYQRNVTKTAICSFYLNFQEIFHIGTDRLMKILAK